MTGMVRAIRGATTLDEDTVEQVEARTQALMREILERNELSIDDLVSVIFTATPDVRSQFPATAARALGLDDVALLGAAEAGIEGGLERCIRVLVHCYTDKSRKELRHVYLEGARALRRDLVEDER
jgi:chorismate mutase